MTTQIYADEVSNLYVANGLVRFELSSYVLEPNGQISKVSAGRVVLHLNGFIGLNAQMEQVIQKMVADGMLKTSSDTSKGLTPPSPPSEAGIDKVTTAKSTKVTKKK